MTNLRFTPVDKRIGTSAFTLLFTFMQAATPFFFFFSLSRNDVNLSQLIQRPGACRFITTIMHFVGFQSNQKKGVATLRVRL